MSSLSNRHWVEVGLVIRLWICLRHSFLSHVFSFFIPISFMSASTRDCHFFFGPPRRVVPSTVMPVHLFVQPLFLWTCPYHRSLFRRHTSVISGILSRSRRVSDLTRSFNFTRHIHLIIVRSVLRVFSMSFFVRAIHSVACSMALRTHVLYT